MGEARSIGLIVKRLMAAGVKADEIGEICGLMLLAGPLATALTLSALMLLFSCLQIIQHMSNPKEKYGVTQRTAHKASCQHDQF